MASADVPDDDLERAGTLLMVAGFLAALVAGSVGLLALGNPVTVILAVGTLVGYGVAGWMLIAIGERALRTAALLAVVFSLFTFGLLGGEVREVIGSAFGNLILFPLIILLLSYAAGSIIGFALSSELERIEWTIRGSDQSNVLLHMAAAPTVWAVFVTVHAAGPQLPAVAASLAIAVAGTVAIVASAGGRLVQHGIHPRYVLAASVLTLGVNAWYLLEFANLEAQIPGTLSASQWIALLGMLLAVFPVAFSAVALYDADIRPEAPADEPGSTG